MPKQNYGAINKWKSENTDRIQILPRKSEHFPERIQLAVEAGKANSRQAYILNAVKQALERDGIPEIVEETVEESENEH